MWFLALAEGDEGLVTVGGAGAASGPGGEVRRLLLGRTVRSVLRGSSAACFADTRADPQSGEPESGYPGM